MTRLVTIAVSVVALLAVGVVQSTAAQPALQQAAAASEERERPVQQAPPAQKIPLQVQVVISRYQGDVRISSMPYVLAVNSLQRGLGGPYGEVSVLRMGARVPVPQLQPTDAQNQNVVAPISPVSYEDIGTNIDCRARGGDGMFELNLSLEDKSVYASDDAAGQRVGPAPAFRTFQSSNTLLLRDGQSQQFTAATDRVTGEVVRVEVTLTVVK